MYHETRKEKGKLQNYLISNQRKGNRWVKQSRFIGYGKISGQKIHQLKKKFEMDLISSKKYLYLTKSQVLELEKLRQAYFEKTNALSKEEFEQFENSYFTELTYNSNSIEGNSLSLEETSLVINEGLVPKGKTLREIYEAKNHAQAIKFLQSCTKDVDEALILKLHSIILNNISERFAGRYREGTVRIFGSDVRFPDAEKVPQLVRNLVYWYKEHKNEYHPFELAVIFSTKLVSIHPFVDGNGRISRLLMNFILQRNKFPWINVYTKQRAEYLQAVRKGNDGEYLLVINFMAKTLKENLESFRLIQKRGNHDSIH
ncbi:Fic family protein [Candidatus Woesearchaeota archaeon]|nr:Fic family protein [Candidatus Woesearchaeota archaeon]